MYELPHKLPNNLRQDLKGTNLNIECRHSAKSIMRNKSFGNSARKLNKISHLTFNQKIANLNFQSYSQSIL